MSTTYNVKIKRKYKEWISVTSVIESKPIYEIFEKVVYPYYQEYFTSTKIEKTILSSDTSQLPLSSSFGKTLRLEAIKKKTNVVSLVNIIFKFYLENQKEKN